jgi:DNA-binding SARP family transcriptional activator
MPTLRTLGGLQLLAADGTPVLGQRLRLALLAVVASGRELGVSRDRLLLLFWPDSTLQNARGSLDQVLYQLRRQLGENAFAGSADPVRLNPELVTDEAGEFERLLGEDRAAEAVALYRGPYLDGFHLGGSIEFDQWIDAERRRLAARYTAAISVLAEAAEGRGDWADALMRWQSLLRVEPLNGRAASGAMAAATRSGDPAAALRLFTGYDAMLRTELGVEPDPAIRALADSIRAGRLQTRRGPEPGELPPGSAAAPVGGRRWWWPVLVAVLAIAAAVVWRSPRAAPTQPSPAGRAGLAVFPFAVLGSDAATSGWMREAIPDLLSARLQLMPGLLVVDPGRAFRAWQAATNGSEPGSSGAERAMARLSTPLAVVGRILVDGATLELAAELVDGRSVRPVEAASVRGPRDSLTELIDGLASRLMAGRSGDPRARHEFFVHLSFPAVRAYLEGRAARRSGRLAEALTAFASAIEIDSTFALAALEFVAATGMLSNRSVAVAGGTRTTVAVPSGPGAARGVTEGHYRRMLALALKHASRLPAPDRAYLQALAGRAYPGETTIRQRVEDWEAAVALAPDRAEVRYQAGLVLLYQAPALGFADAWPRANAELQAALRLDPLFPLPWLGLMEAAGLRGDWAAAADAADRFLAIASEGELTVYARWFREAATGRRSARPVFSAGIDAASSNVLGSVALASQVHGIGLGDGDRADSLLTTRATTRAQRRIAYYDRAIFLLNRGLAAEAAAAMEVKNGYDPYAHVGLFQILRFGMYWDGDSAQTAAAARTLSELLERTTARDTIAWAQPAARDRAAWFLAQWHLWRGEAAAARRFRDQLSRVGPPRPEPALLPFLDALEVVLGGGLAAQTAATRLDSLAQAECCGVFANLVAARALRRAGLITPALAAARRGRWARLPEHLSAYLIEEAELALAAHDTAGARLAIAHLAALSSTAAPARSRRVTALREAAGLAQAAEAGPGVN